jgi:hypothetical protein
MNILSLPFAVFRLALPSALHAQTYWLTALGVPGESESHAISINASNVVASYSYRRK